MFRNYLVTAVRNIRRHKAYSFINIAGLAIGLACSFFIALWVQDELSYDTYLEDGDQVYQVMRHATFGENRVSTTSLPKPLAAALADDYPEITHTALGSWEHEMLFSRENTALRAPGRYFGPDFFAIFKLPMIVGDPETALLDPLSVAMSESMVERHLGADWRTREDLLGTTFRVDNRIDVQLTAVFKDLPSASSLQMDFWGSRDLSWRASSSGSRC
ncbi:MAG: putative ABC transport system permease protein [Rhodothermales bacterium]|jgi:putative ABC transport system permease protein